MKYQPKLYLHGASGSNISIKIHFVTHVKPENKCISTGEMNSPSETKNTAIIDFEAAEMLRGTLEIFMFYLRILQQKAKSIYECFGMQEVNYFNGLSGTGASATSKLWNTISILV